VRDVKSLFDHLQVLYLDADALDPQGIIFSNLNRPQDLEDMKDLKSK
jgi:molybdopterin-guanine dinucleotide biosynthesis protein A